MTVKLNHDQLDHHVPLPRDDNEARVDDASLYGEINGQVAVGRYLLQIGEPCGALVREASRSERAHIRPRPTPVFLRPRLIRGLFDRRSELAAALSALDAALPVEITGEPGIGKTAFLRHLAHHPRAASFVDGIVYLQARHRTSADLQQLLFEAFYESDEICKPTEMEIRRGLQDRQALILLDDVRVAQHELEQILDLAPRSAFVVATRERSLWGEARSLALKGLPAEDAVLLVEREMERALDVVEPPAAASLCAALEGHPRRILQAAGIAREQGMSLDVCARTITPANLMPELVASIDEKQRRAMLALAALPGVPLRVQDISGIADVTDIEPSLMMLVRRGVLVSGDSRHRLAAGVGDQLRRRENLTPWVNRAITYFTAWAERHRRSPGTLLEESETLACVQQSAADARRYGEMLRVGRLLEGALIVGARWGAWAATLEHCLAAAKAIGDRSAEAWALHELGTRALCLGDPGLARTSLRKAATMRDGMGDAAAAAASRQNLSFVVAPEPAPAAEPAAALPIDPPLDVLDFDSLPLREDVQPVARRSHTGGVGAVIVTLLLTAGVAGIAYWAGPPGQRWNFERLNGFLQRSRGTTALPAQGPPAPQAPHAWDAPDRGVPGESAAVGTTASRASEPDRPASGEAASDLAAPGAEPPPASSGLPASESTRASILIFSPRPGSVAAGGPTRLCYAVSDAVEARVEPGIGDVLPTNTLTCLRVAPARTTTYQLTASGRDGYRVRQQLVIIVR